MGLGQVLPNQGRAGGGQSSGSSQGRLLPLRAAFFKYLLKHSIDQGCPTSGLLRTMCSMGHVQELQTMWAAPPHPPTPGSPSPNGQPRTCPHPMQHVASNPFPLCWPAFSVGTGGRRKGSSKNPGAVAQMVEVGGTSDSGRETDCRPHATHRASVRQPELTRAGCGAPPTL